MYNTKPTEYRQRKVKRKSNNKETKRIQGRTLCTDKMETSNFHWLLEIFDDLIRMKLTGPLGKMIIHKYSEKKKKKLNKDKNTDRPGWHYIFKGIKLKEKIRIFYSPPMFKLLFKNCRKTYISPHLTHTTLMGNLTQKYQLIKLLLLKKKYPIHSKLIILHSVI
jgi:hypothetical protein